MKESKKDKESNRISDEFDMIQSTDDDMNLKESLDLSIHLASEEDLPDLGSLELYDYDADMKISTQKSLDLVESLVDLYLSDFERVRDHPYIKNKVKEDAVVYAEIIFLQKMTRKNFLTQLRQIDNGENSARMHEVINQTIAQIRDNNKFASTQRNDLEKYYKEFRQDLMEVKPESKEESSESEPSDMLMDSKHLNDLIHKAMTNKKSKENND